MTEKHTSDNGGKGSPNSALILLLAGAGLALLVVAITASPTSIPGQSGAMIPATSVLIGRILLGLLGLVCLGLAVVFGLGLGPLVFRLWDRRGKAPAAIDSGLMGTPVTAPVGRLPVEVRGREAMLRALRRQARHRRGMVVLAGMGGVGKSTIAAQLAQQLMKTGVGQRRRLVWWVSATDITSLTAGLLTVARQLGASEADMKAIIGQSADGPDRLWARLEQTRPGWLLVVDNADDPRLLGAPASLVSDQEASARRSGAASVADGTGWVRPSDRGLIVVTSRQADPTIWGRQAAIQLVGPLSDTDSARVLCDLAPQAGGQGEAQALGRRLGGLPLALYLAGSYLGSGIARWSSFATYRQALDREPAAVSSLSPDPDTERATNQRAAVMHTWEISLDALARNNLPQARPVLRLLSCYASAVPIPVDLLMSDHIGTLLDAMSDEEGTIGESARQMEQALRGLVRLGLIDTLAIQQAVIVHPVVADTNRIHLLTPGNTRDPNPVLIRHTAVMLLVAAINALDAVRPTDWPRFHLLTPHIQALLTGSAAHLDRDHLAALVEATARVANAYHWSGELPMTARDLTTAALAYSSRLGEDHPAILKARTRLAYATGQQGRWAEAETAFREVLAVQRQVRGYDHPDTLTTRHGLAWVVASQGRWAEAEAALREVVDTRRSVLGDNHPDTLTARHELFRRVANQGRWAEAEAGFREVLAAKRRVLGDDHRVTLTTRHELSRMVANQGRWGEAEAAFRGLLAVRRRVLGEDHPDTLVTRHELSRTLAQHGRLAEAEVALRDILKAEQRVLGDDHPDTLSTRHELASVFAQRGQLEEAEAAFRDVLEVEQRVLGDDHPETLSTRHELASVFAQRGRLDEAEAAFRDVLQAKQRILGVDHPSTAITRQLLVHLRAT